VVRMKSRNQLGKSLECVVWCEVHVRGFVKERLWSQVHELVDAEF